MVPDQPPSWTHGREIDAPYTGAASAADGCHGRPCCHVLGFIAMAVTRAPLFGKEVDLPASGVVPFRPAFPNSPARSFSDGVHEIMFSFLKLCSFSYP